MCAENLEIKVEGIDFVETSKGSIYKYLPDGRTQRFKKTKNITYEPQDAIVFIPDYNTIIKSAPKELVEKNVFGENELQFEQMILSYVSENKKSCIIINEWGQVLKTNKPIDETKYRIFVAFVNEERDGTELRDKIDFYVPVSRVPKFGYSPFDAREYESENGRRRESHIGNKVARILLKDGKEIVQQENR